MFLLNICIWNYKFLFVKKGYKCVNEIILLEIFFFVRGIFLLVEFLYKKDK